MNGLSPRGLSTFNKAMSYIRSTLTRTQGENRANRGPSTSVDDQHDVLVLCTMVSLWCLDSLRAYLPRRVHSEN